MTTTDLAGRRALVTGGSRGIGAGIVRRLAADGAAVAFTYVGGSEAADALVAEVDAEGGRAVAIKADAADAAAIAAAVERAVTELDGLDILVNNAGTAILSPVEEFTAADFDRLLAINVGGVFWAVHSALPHLQDGARIINIGSVNADRIPGPGVAVYGLTKGAVSSFTRGLARELGPRNITVNNVQPGPIATDLNPPEGEFAESLKSILPLGRYGEAADVAALVSFLSGPQASFITGANLNVDGGFTV
jgi:3-oxoacyl-[acyl-carrier protein] reductase